MLNKRSFVTSGESTFWIHHWDRTLLLGPDNKRSKLNQKVFPFDAWLRDCSGCLWAAAFLYNLFSHSCFFLDRHCVKFSDTYGSIRILILTFPLIWRDLPGYQDSGTSVLLFVRQEHRTLLLILSVAGIVGVVLEVRLIPDISFLPSQSA